MLEFGRAHTNK